MRAKTLSPQQSEQLSPLAGRVGRKVPELPGIAPDVVDLQLRVHGAFRPKLTVDHWIEPGAMVQQAPEADDQVV